MPTFKYNAVDNLGKKVKDSIDADSAADATEKIRELGYFPTSVKEAKSGKSKKAGASAGKPKKKGAITIGGVSAKQLNTFTRQLSTLINADVPIVRSLGILESQMKPGRLKNSLDAIVTDIEEGTSLSDAMAKHKKAFSKIYVNTLKAGEIGGMLDEILNRLADFLEKMDRLKKKIISSLVYPVSVMVMAGAIISGIMMFIIPNFVKMFADMEIEGGLPAITQMVVAASNFMVNSWYILFGVPFVMFVMMKIGTKIKKIKYYMDLMAFKIPVFGLIINKSVVSSFCRTLATLSTAGVPILEALVNTRDATKNEVMICAITGIYESVREGGTIEEPLKKSKVTDAIVINMVAVGEETGELDKMLVKVADNMDTEIDALVESMTSLIEPLMMAGLGGAIGFIVIAMFMPMIKMMNSLA